MTLRKREEDKLKFPAFAPGIDDDEELNQDATKAEISRGEFTTVYKLSFDEVDPS
ncbi:hypothetical protein HNQ85_000694 [Anoxybacillus calidus]|jgi:hypothetical protein|uniref:Uncharacterized protein n=1 Tax=[Anoxybacillus] calidus TaxID=575178 RepID=A0A7V9YXU1_9BACL|nr:hypothetical protein [Anoxybacillus calidus]MBA2870436.1 hypothetical protein [Anoxybacillus calidus]